MFQKADIDCAYKARELGYDTVKQWNSTLDGKTRKSHQRVDKEWRELDEPFSNGLMYPKEPGGKAAEVINCRCSLDDVPRWYVLKGGGQYRREGITGNIIKCKNYAEFKEKYLKMLQDGVTMNWDNETVRHWYYNNCNKIPNLIDKTAPIEQQAKEAFLLRNEYKVQARRLMSDRKAAAELMRNFPVQSFEEKLAEKMSGKGLSRDEAIADILKTATKTNKKVNEKYGIKE